MGELLQRRRTVVMTAARHVANALRDLDPEDSSDLDIASYVLKVVHEELGPGQWAHTPPAEYVLAVQQLLPACRVFSTPSDWFESLQSGVVALEAAQHRSATLADIGTVLQESANTPGEQLMRLVERMALNCCMAGMLVEFDVPADELATQTIASLQQHVPNAADIPAFRDPVLIGRLVSKFADALRLSVARSTSLLLTEDSTASNDAIAGTAAHLLLRTLRRLQTMDENVVVGFVAYVTSRFAPACRAYGDPNAWYAAMQRFAAEGGWRTRRR